MSMTSRTHPGLLHAVETADSTSTPISTKGDRVTLQVGERRFTTFRDTLISESSYFKARLTRWNDAEEDGSYFIDADPGIFEHILAFLRGGSFPFFFDAGSQSFDYPKYLALADQARYFGIPELEEWITKQRYLDAIKIDMSTMVIGEVGMMGRIFESTSTADTRRDVSLSWDTKDVYICPRRIPVHRGDPTRCGRACDKERERLGTEPDFEKEPVLRATITTTKTVFNPAACLRGSADVARLE
ncbi:hypothetical protein DL771_003366 [Monosporascus sp. 5C6A]|nr:hypothetical protein DL771_003366 [Monosporascus sp. 5C6A]